MSLTLKIEKKKVVKKTSRNRKAGYYRISDLVYDFKLTPRTLRLYDDLGILTPLREGEHRYYDQAQHDRLLVILQAQYLGLRLQDLAKIFAANGDVTLRDIVKLLSSRQLLAQREELMRRRRYLDNVVLAIESALRDRDQEFRVGTPPLAGTSSSDHLHPRAIEAEAPPSPAGVQPPCRRVGAPPPLSSKAFAE